VCVVKVCVCVCVCLCVSKELDQAVTAEQYERAAELRDRLRHIDEAPTSPQVVKQARRKASKPPKKD